MSLATSLNPFLNLQLPADTDLVSPQDNPSPLTPVLADLDPSLNDEKLYSSSEIEQLPFYIKFPTHPCAWFIVDPGYFRRAYSSDETKLKSGAALNLKDRTISTNMLTEEYPTHYICMTKLICRDRGYVIYKFTFDLFSCFCTPQPAKLPTNLVTIPEFHASDEAAHLITQEATFHQRVLETDYAITPLCT
ncbi:hypothetical protein PILCRDRAFT_641 [Piloderma croceum F 1598]|uniref:Uncharacterized protein n=1 Tax=Piloderma croceum (strain F 1598) TaxID=765440 RepID=A0A0C3BY25_PILCF|nr:hypothetical protein PILCRDRAFT_641 [Piloderma croceum F 1598]